MTLRRTAANARTYLGLLTLIILVMVSGAIMIALDGAALPAAVISIVTIPAVMVLGRAWGEAWDDLRWWRGFRLRSRKMRAVR